MDTQDAQNAQNAQDISEDETQSLPPMSNLSSIFSTLVDKAIQYGLAQFLEHNPAKRLSIATMCSGTESPIFALQMIKDELADRGISFSFEHRFSAEIVPFKQAFIERNFRPPICYRDITELSSGQG